MVSQREFCTLLKAAYAPHYSYPRINNPKKLWSSLQTGTIVTKRVVKNGTVEKEQTVRIDSNSQKKIYDTLMGLTIGTINSYVIGISSYPHEHLSTMTAANIVWSLLKNIPTLRWRFFTPAWDPSKENLSAGAHPNVVVLRGILPIEDRLYRIRDILDAFPRSLRLVALANIDPIDYFDNYLCLPLSGAINLIGTQQRLPDSIYVKSSQDSDFEIPSLLPEDAALLLKALRKDI